MKAPNRTCVLCSKAFYVRPSDLLRSAALYCSRACYLAAINTPVSEALKNYKEDANGCWNYQGAMRPNGYPYVTETVEGRSRKLLLNRAVLARHHGVDISDASILACHRCDNRACIRPDHIFAGSHAINQADKVAKGRQAKGDHSGPRLHPERLKRGEQHYAAKLTPEAIQDIQQRYLAGGVSQRSLANEYGVHQSTISYLLSGRNWKRIGEHAAQELSMRKVRRAAA